MALCPNCHMRYSDEYMDCPRCGRKQEKLGWTAPVYTSGAGLRTQASSVATTSYFGEVADAFKSPTAVIKSNIFEDMFNQKIINLLESLGYLYKDDKNNYRLTEKGKEAFVQNKLFRDEVEEILQKK